MRKVLQILLLFIPIILIAQKNKSCSTPEENLEDSNSITKCTISKKSNKKNTKQISVSVSAPKKRYLKKRGTNKNNPMRKKLATKKISNNLSSEEINKAEKFITVDEIPTFKKCATTSGDERTDCFNTEMIKHIEKHFHYPNEAVMKKIEGQVWVRFIIDSEGNISNIKTHGPKNGEVLEEEALRVVSHLPIFIPGKKGGKNISVKYGFPIDFQLGE